MSNNPEHKHFDVTPQDPLGKVRSIWAGTALSVCSCLTALPAEGDGGRAAGQSDDWAFSVSPYFWAAGIEGTTGTLPGLPAADVDMSFGDIFDDLKPSGMVLFNATKGRLGLAADLQYVETEAESSSLSPLFGRETLRSTSLVASAIASYLVVDDGRMSLRLGGGVRLWSVETDLKLSSGLLPGRRITSEETWVDPIVGGTGVVDLGPKVFARGWAYAGGFGIASDIMADLYVGLGYQFTDKISANLGYRWVKVDYEDGDFLYDVRQEGIATGVTFDF